MTEHSEYADRNTDLFFDIADILEFFPEQYRQSTWGEFAPSQVDYDNFEAQFGYDTQTQFAGEDGNWIYADEECGSHLCVAGHAAALRGWLPTTHTSVGSGEVTVQWQQVSKTAGADYRSDGSKDVSTVAQELLGINEREARHLFDSEHEWTANDLRKFGKGERILTHVDED